MAALYDFRLQVRRAEFSDGFMTVPYGKTEDVYHEECAQLTYAAAQTRLAELSAAESRTHKASISMKYREDRCPPGFKKSPFEIRFDGVERRIP